MIWTDCTLCKHVSEKVLLHVNFRSLHAESKVISSAYNSVPIIIYTCISGKITEEQYK